MTENTELRNRVVRIPLFERFWVQISISMIFIIVESIFRSKIIDAMLSVKRPRPLLTAYFPVPLFTTCQSQWPRVIRLDMSSLVRTLGSWVRIPLKAWMSLYCAFILFVLFFV
jgi:hypothetical protein